MLHHLEEQGILIRKGKNRYPSGKGEKLYAQLRAGEIPVGLPKTSEKLTKDREVKEQTLDQYLEIYRQQYGAPPSLEEATRLLEELWSVPSITRKQIAQLLQKETGISISEVTISRYKLGKRTMPEYVRAALQLLHRQLKPKDLAQIEEKEKEHLDIEEKRVQECLKDLFHKGLSYSDITKELRREGFNVSRDILYQQAQGSMRTYPNQIHVIFKLWERINQDYPSVPTPKKVAEMLQILEARGYSLATIATMVYEILPAGKKRTVSHDSMSVILRRFKEQPERKKPIHLEYRIAIKRIFEKLSTKIYSVSTIDSRLGTLLAAKDIPIDARKSPLTNKGLKSETYLYTVLSPSAMLNG